MVVIINNVSDSEWSLILSALKAESSNSVMNEIFPKRKEQIDKLINKIEGNKPKFTLSHRTDR